MKSRFFQRWVIGLAGFFFAIFLVPSSMVGQAKGPIQYKMMKTADLIKMANPKPSERFRMELLGEKEQVKHLGGIMVILPPSPAGQKVAYHFHKNRESVIMMIDAVSI